MTALTDSLAYALRGLSRYEAARYIGVDATKFDEMVSDGRMPRPKRVDGRVIWDPLRIEAAFAYELIAGKQFTTLANIAEMRRLCQTSARDLDSGNDLPNAKDCEPYHVPASEFDVC